MEEGVEYYRPSEMSPPQPPQVQMIVNEVKE